VPVALLELLLEQEYLQGALAVMGQVKPLPEAVVVALLATEGVWAVLVALALVLVLPGMPVAVVVAVCLVPQFTTAAAVLRQVALINPMQTAVTVAMATTTREQVLAALVLTYQAVQELLVRALAAAVQTRAQVQAAQGALVQSTPPRAALRLVQVAEAVPQEVITQHQPLGRRVIMVVAAVVVVQVQTQLADRARKV
jgi:hypothetical protein